MVFAFGAFAVVEGAGCRVGAGGALGGQITGTQEPAMVAAGSFEVAADAPGIARYRRESTDASEAWVKLRCGCNFWMIWRCMGGRSFNFAGDSIELALSQLTHFCGRSA